jgi:hypothetical protein
MQGLVFRLATKAMASSRHFYVYDASGKLCEDHGLGIRQAREKKAMVSPTTALSEVFKKPYGIELWQKQRLAEACDANPRFANEEIKAYTDRMEHIASEKLRVAQEFGIKLHHATEQPRGSYVIPEMQGYVDYYWQWMDENVQQIIAIEEIVADTRIGVAGKLDQRVIMKTGEMAILDIKNSSFEKKPNIGESHCPQIALYRSGIVERYGLSDKPRGINLHFNRDYPMPVWPKEWTAEELDEGYVTMKVAAWCWSRQNKHWPNGPWSLSIS